MWIYGSLMVLVFMASVWALFYKKTNAGIVDIAWALSFSVAALAALALGNAGLVKKAIFSLMVFPWSLRLAYHLYSRFDKNVEDPRYTKIKKGWGEDKGGFKMLMMFLFQGVLASIISIPFYLIANDPSMGLLLPGFLVVTLGWIGEAVADYQLKQFKDDPRNKGKVLDKGLWGISRHPNYFFEWIVWAGFTFSALFLDYGYLSLISFAIISYLLMGLSGVKLTEEQLSESKGEAYEEYKRRVPAFFPNLKF